MTLFAFCCQAGAVSAHHTIFFSFRDERDGNKKKKHLEWISWCQNGLQETIKLSCVIRADVLHVSECCCISLRFRPVSRLTGTDRERVVQLTMWPLCSFLPLWSHAAAPWVRTSQNGSTWCRGPWRGPLSGSVAGNPKSERGTHPHRGSVRSDGGKRLWIYRKHQTFRMINMWGYFSILLYLYWIFAADGEERLQSWDMNVYSPQFFIYAHINNS